MVTYAELVAVSLPLRAGPVSPVEEEAEALEDTSPVFEEGIRH